MKTDLGERPDLSITLSTGQKIKMTYGLEMDLRRILPDPAQALRLVLDDPFTQDYVIRRCLTPNKNFMVGTQDDLIKEIDEDLLPDDTEKLIIWAVSHILYFFAKRATSLENLVALYPTPQPDQSTIGLKNSASTTPSAGPLG